MWSVVMKAVLAAILGMVEWLAAPGSVPAAPHSPAPLESGSEATAGVFALLRAIDPCALHDMAAAVVITGDHPDTIVPGPSLATCQLRLYRDQKPTWTFTVDIGVPFPPIARQTSILDDVDGKRLYHSENAKEPGSSCTYFRPMGPAHGISLTAVAPTDHAAANPCSMAKAYVTAAKVLTRLVLRAQNRTQPHLGLGLMDPCAAGPAVLDLLGVRGTVAPQALYVCRIQPQPPQAPAAAPPVTISFGFGADPGVPEGAGTGQAPVTVEGHRGVVTFATQAQQCVVTIAYDPDMAFIKVNHATWVQTVSVHAVSCEQAKPIAGAVVHEVSTR